MVPRAARGGAKTQVTSPRRATEAELHTHSLMSTLSGALWDRGLGPTPSSVPEDQKGL